MKEGLIGRKIGMTQLFGEDGNVVPATVLRAGPCTVVELRGKASHGYDAVQLGFEELKRSATKPIAGHFKKAGVASMRVLREIRLVKSDMTFQPGQRLTVELFRVGELVDVTGISKGKGFQGGVKRHGWAGGDATHGSMFHRAPGSIGASSDPSRVWPGHGLPGRMGRERVTTPNLEVVRILPDQQLLLVKGALPGPNGQILMVRKSVKQTKKQQQVAKG